MRTTYVDKLQNKKIVESTLVGVLHSVISSGFEFRFRALGFSMQPAIQDGQMISVKALGEKAPAINDIIAFIHPAHGKLYVHRIQQVKSGFYLCQGDNLSMPDGWIPEENIVGRVSVVNPDEQPADATDARDVNRSLLNVILKTAGKNRWCGKMAISYYTLRYLFKTVFPSQQQAIAEEENGGV